jgi:small-conductance mechanosensitive channel
MDFQFFTQDKQWSQVVQSGALALIVFAVAMAVRGWVLARLRRQAERDPKSFAALLQGDLGAPSLIWCLVAALEALLNFMPLSEKAISLSNALAVGFLIFSFTLVASGVLLRAMARYGEENNLPFAVAGLSKTLTRAIVFSIGLLVLLNFLGISITPMLTALGVGGLAVALALQDTLANFFAGLHILIERPIALGDYVRISADEEGTVTDIGWRTTRLLTTTNSVIVIPNKNLTNSNLVNLAMPAPAVVVHVPVMLGMEADIEAAEKIALAAAAATEGVLPNPPPIFLADPGMQPTHLQYRLAFHVPQQLGSGITRTKVLSRLLAEFRKAGIPLPEAGRLLTTRG